MTVFTPVKSGPIRSNPITNIAVSDRLYNEYVNTRQLLHKKYIYITNKAMHKLIGKYIATLDNDITLLSTGDIGIVEYSKVIDSSITLIEHITSLDL